MKKLIAALVVTLSGAALAGPITNREAVQQARIAHGIRDGQITPGEAIRLERGERRIERVRERDLRNDGRIGPIERFRLERRLNHESREIYRDAHNRRSW
jgi:hypothetical protein